MGGRRAGSGGGKKGPWVPEGLNAKGERQPMSQEQLKGRS